MSEEREPQVQTAIRLPESMINRLDSVAKKMSQPGMPVTRTEVLRLAAHRGLDELEAEWKKR